MEACKQRVVEMRDELLFRQPEGSHLGDCPICFLPLPLDRDDYVMTPCCSKTFCQGCRYSDPRIECPFCRHSEWEEDPEKTHLKRVDANDPAALTQMGGLLYVKGDFAGAFRYYSKAARLGDAGAHGSLSCMYQKGEGVEKDEKKSLHHAEEAAIGGHPITRYLLACFELENGRCDRAAKHLIIAAKLGHDESIQALKAMYTKEEGRRVLSKDDFASALRGHQAAVDAAKSKQREESKAFLLLELEKSGK